MKVLYIMSCLSMTGKNGSLRTAVFLLSTEPPERRISIQQHFCSVFFLARFHHLRKKESDPDRTARSFLRYRNIHSGYRKGKRQSYNLKARNRSGGAGKRSMVQKVQGLYSRPVLAKYSLMFLEKNAERRAGCS